MDKGQTEKSVQLSSRQEIAVREMVKGKGVVATAKLVGVNRVTLYRWMQEPAFVAAMNRWRASVTDAARGQMFGLLADAAQAVAVAVRKGDARLALTVLEKMGALERPGGVEGLVNRGAGMDAETVIRQAELDRRAGQLELDQIEVQLTQAEEMNLMTRKIRMPTAQEIAEQDRVRRDERELALARKAAEQAEAVETSAIAGGGESVAARQQAEREQEPKAEAPSESARAASRLDPSIDQPAGEVMTETAMGQVIAEVAESAIQAGSVEAKECDSQSGRMSPAEIEEVCNRLTRRRGQPARPPGSEISPPSRRAAPPSPEAPDFIGPPIPRRPGKPYGGLNPFADGPVDPIDPLDEAFTEIARFDR